MHIEKENTGLLTAKLKLNIHEADYKPKWEESLKNYRKRAAMPGFRPGNAPMSLIKKKFGKNILAEELNDLINRSLQDYLVENKIAYLGNPLPTDSEGAGGNWDEPADFSFEYEIGLAPEFKISLDPAKKYIRYKVVLDEAFIDERVKDLARRYGKLSDPEVSEDGDLLLGTFIQLDENDQILAGGIFNDSTVTIETVTDADTKAKLIGLKIGNEVVVNPHHVSRSHDDLAKMLGITHHDVHHLHGNFMFRVKEVKRLTPTEVDQNLFDKIFGKDAVKDEADFRGRIRADFERRMERDAERLFNNRLVEETIDQVNPELPDEFLKRWLMASGNADVTGDELDREYPRYARALRWQLIEQRVAVDNNIRITEDDLKQHAKAAIAAQYAQYGIPMDDEQLEPLAANALANEKDRKEIVETILEGRVVEALTGMVYATEQSISYEDFIKETNKGKHEHHEHHHHHDH
jgi:trigger factor